MLFHYARLDFFHLSFHIHPLPFSTVSVPWEASLDYINRLPCHLVPVWPIEGMNGRSKKGRKVRLSIVSAPLNEVIPPQKVITLFRWPVPHSLSVFRFQQLLPPFCPATEPPRLVSTLLDNYSK